MRFKYLFNAVFILLIGVIQGTFPRAFEIGYSGIKPNLLLVYIILYAFFNGSYKGAIIGFIAGLTQDLLTGGYIGLYALLGLLIGLIIGWTNSKIYKENFIVAIVLIFIGTIIYETIVGLSLGIHLITSNNFLFATKFIVLPEALYNCVISIIIYFFMRYINNRINKKTIRETYRLK